MLICIGGTALDLHARVEHPLVYGSSNPGRITMSPGGVARNIAENTARLGVPVTLVTWVGTDPLVDWVLDRTRETGVRIVARSGLGASAQYLSVLQSGEPLVAVSDFGAIQEVTATEVTAALEEAVGTELGQAPTPLLVAADCNLPVAALTACIQWCAHRDVDLLLEPVSVAKAMRLRELRGRISYVTPNTEEARALGWDYARDVTVAADATVATDATGAAFGTPGPMFGTWVVTRGVHGAAVWRNGEDRAMLYRMATRRVVNANGAGDAFVAGLLAGIHEDLPIEESVSWALAAGAITVVSERTVAPEISREAILHEIEYGR